MFVYWYSSHLSSMTQGGPLVKVCSSTKFCVLVFKASMLYLGRSICQSRFICQVLCTGIQVISPLLPGGSSAKVGSSATFCVLVFMSSLPCYPGGSIGQSMFICQVLCTGIQVISPLLPGGFTSQSRFVCQVLCTGIQGIYALFGGSICQSSFVCQALCTDIQVISPLLHGVPISQSRFVCQVLCTGIQVISPSITWGSISQSRFICQVLCTGIQVITLLLPGGFFSQRRFIWQVLCTGIQVISSLLPGGGFHQPKYVHLQSVVYWYSGHLSPVTQGGPLAKGGSSAKFCVLVFKSSLLYYLGGFISQSRFICQVLCTGIQVISPLLPREVHWPKEVHLTSFVYWYSRCLCSIWGVHLPKKVHLPSFVYWYSSHLSFITWGAHQPK